MAIKFTTVNGVDFHTLHRNFKHLVVMTRKTTTMTEYLKMCMGKGVEKSHNPYHYSSLLYVSVYVRPVGT